MPTADTLIAQAESDARLYARGDEKVYAQELIRNLKYHIEQLCIDLETERKLHAATSKLYQGAIDPFKWTDRSGERVNA